jgi:hypothetical protein
VQDERMRQVRKYDLDVLLLKVLRDCEVLAHTCGSVPDRPHHFASGKVEGEKKGEERKTCFVSKKKSPHELIMQEVLLIFNLWMVIAY